MSNRRSFQQWDRARPSSSGESFRPSVSDVSPTRHTDAREGLRSTGGGDDVGGTIRRVSEDVGAGPRLEPLGLVPLALPRQPPVRARPSPAAGVTPERSVGVTSVPSMAGTARDGDGRPIPWEAFYADVVCTWFGPPDTAYFHYDETSRSYALGGGSAAQREVAAVLTEVGGLAHRIDALLRTRSLSFLQQSLKASVRKQLTAYFIYVAELRQSLNPRCTFPTLASVRDQLTPKLEALLSLLQEAEQAKGGELITKLLVVHRQGSSRLVELLDVVYSETMVPLMSMIGAWLSKGEAPDPYMEFFIAVREKVRDTDDEFWLQKYTAREEMLPATLSLTTARRIVLAAKNVAFIRRCCKLREWSLSAETASAAAALTMDTLPHVVDRAVEETNKAVMTTLRDAFHLDSYIVAIRGLLLIGEGDLFESIIRRLDPILSRMGGHINASVVRDEVKSAVLEMRLHTVDARILHALEGDMDHEDRSIGWEVFFVRLPIPSPLNAIFDNASMQVYKRLFRSILRVKRAEVAMKYAWRQSVWLDRAVCRLSPQDADTEAFRDVARAAHLLGLKLMHFVGNVWSYITSEVNISSWTAFRAAMKSASSIDDARRIHESFLEQLRKLTLLHGDCVSIRHNVEAVLGLARQFCASQGLLSNLLERRHGDVFMLRAEYHRIASEFNREVTNLLSTLEDQHLHYDFMGYLLLRLNFNHYYASDSTS